jgi:hypothetical protein
MKSRYTSKNSTKSVFESSNTIKSRYMSKRSKTDILFAKESVECAHMVTWNSVHLLE